MADIPARLDTSDPAFADFVAEIGEGTISVLLDGVEVAGDCRAYDLEAQSVTRPVLDGQGQITLTEDRNAIVYETVHGKVEVSILPPERKAA